MKSFIFSCLFLLLFCFSHAHANSTVFDRIMESGKIRCGYYMYNPALMKDEKTGEFYGAIYEILMNVSEILELEIEWVEEVSISSAVTGLQTNRYDLLCTGFYERPNVMKHVEFIGPFYYSSVNAYVRIDDDRFDNDIDKINNPEHTISSIDGSIPDIIWRESFSKAKRFSLPELSPYSDNLLNVATGKADVTFVENAIANEYLANNPETLKKLEPPVRVFPVVFYAKKGELELKSMLNSAIRHLHNNGQIEKIIQKYERQRGDYLRVVPPYIVLD